jgi:hypothetical protein
MSIPWTTVDHPEAGPKTVVLVTWFVLDNRWRTPAFLLHGPPLWWQARHSPGMLGVAFRAQPFKCTFWTLSAWTDRRSLASYTRTNPHRAAMERVRPWMHDFVRASWDMPTADLPTSLRTVGPLWEEAERRVAKELEARR